MSTRSRSPRGSRGSSRPGRRPGASRPRTPASAQTQPAPRARFTGRAAILVLVLAVLMVSYASSVRSYIEQRQHLSGLRTSITDSRANIEDLRREKTRWDDPAYVEAQARQRFGWVMPGEIGYQVIDTDGEPLRPDDSLTDPDAVGEVDTPEWWQTAWGTMQAAGNPEDVPRPVDRIGELKKKKQR